MNSPLAIRDASTADLPDIARLYEASGLDLPGSTDIDRLADAWQRQRRETPGARVLLAMHGGRTVGTLGVFVLPLLAHGGAPAALVEGVAVDPALQGQGVGRALMDAAMQIARDAGCYKLALSSNLKRDSAHAFYRRLGYTQHGISFAVDTKDTTP
jgi:GNAT superfamily N-acetyltransferase